MANPLKQIVALLTSIDTKLGQLVEAQQGTEQIQAATASLKALSDQLSAAEQAAKEKT